MDNENNDYYEPAIKTMRNKMSSITINTDKIKFDNDKVEIKMDKVYINNKEYIEKQQLISFLEDKIKENSEATDFHLHNTNNFFTLLKLSGKYDGYKEVLYFVNKGGKDESRRNK